MMNCYNCTKEVSTNTLAELDQEDWDQVVEWFGLIRCEGPDSQFDSHGTVVICRECCNLAL